MDGLLKETISNDADTYVIWNIVNKDTERRKGAIKKKRERERRTKNEGCGGIESNRGGTHKPYLPTPPLGQDMTQGQFLSRV